MHRKIKITILGIFTVLLLSGCSIKKPGETSMQKPKLPDKQQEVKEALNNILKKEAKLINPAEGKNRNSIQFIDIDGDGEEEVIALYKVINEEEPLRFNIIKRINGHWQSVGEVSNSAFSIHKIEYVNLEGGNLKDILVGWQLADDMKRGLSIYRYEKGRVNEIFSSSYSEMGIEDFDGDDKAEAILVSLDKENIKAKAVMYKYIDNKVKAISEVPMDGAINGYSMVKVGKASKDKKGMFLEMGMGAHSEGTSLLVVKDGKLQNVFYDEEKEMTELTFRPYPMVSEDIDKDGIIEIPIQSPAPGYEDACMADTEWITNWYKWDGKNGLNLAFSNYYNYIDGYFLNFPQKWTDKVTVDAPKDIEKEHWRKFSYIDRNTSKKVPFFTIYCFDQNSIDKSKIDNMIEVGKKLNRVYMVKINNSEKDNDDALKEVLKLFLNVEEIKSNIGIIDISN